MNRFLQLIDNNQKQFLGIGKPLFFIIALFILGSIVPKTAVGEGTNEICADDSNETYLYLCNDIFNGCGQGRSQFAVFGCEENDRLNFVIKSTNETVYFGLKGTIPNNSDFDRIRFRVKDAAGNIVFAEADVPSSGVGYIDNVSQARVGPNQLAGTGGYDAYEITSLPVGTYYIEFDGVRDFVPGEVGSFQINYLDITINDNSTNTIQPGRLFSKGWQFLEDSSFGGWDTNSSTFFIYSTDQIITSVTFDDMEGRAWTIFCNATGCINTGDFEEDRKSLNGVRSSNLEYNIFVNIPDPDLFPPATTVGAIVEPLPYGESNCSDGSILFHVNVDKAGNAEISLEFPPPYVNTTLTQGVVLGENLMLWDGNDGAGDPVPHNVTINFTVTYINGLTNLPLYDIEGNLNGFRINLIQPTGATPLVFWDDSNIPDGTTNFLGCNSTLPNPGCHQWGVDGEQYGNENTINTWWYSASTSTAAVPILEERGPQILVWDPTPATDICPGEAVIFTLYICYLSGR